MREISAWIPAEKQRDEAYISQECMEKARKRRALQRSFDVEISQERLEEIFEELMTYEQKSD